MKKLILTERKLSQIKKGLVEGLTIASGAKSTATYYHSRKEQTEAIIKSVSDLYGISKELPLILANQKGVNGVFIQEVLLNEFKRTSNGGSCNVVNPIDWIDNGISDKAILSALNSLNVDNGITYVLRMFQSFKERKINNERSRKIALGFIWGNENLEFISIKYRNKLRSILKHIYGEKKLSILISIARNFILNNGLYNNEKELNISNKLLLRYNEDNLKLYKVLLFIVNDYKNIDYKSFNLINEFLKAKFVDILSIKNVPEEVLIGLVSNKYHNQYNDLWSTEEKRKNTKAIFRKNTKVTSITQQVRQTKSTKKLGVNKTINLDKVVDYLSLYKTGYEDGFTDDLKLTIDKLASKNKFTNFNYNNIGVIIDKSPSMNGHEKESKNTPRAITSFTGLILKKSVANSEFVGSEGSFTDLATSFVKLMKLENSNNKYEAIFILSDGYENGYESLLNEVVSIYLKDTNRNLPMFHVSPITGAEVGGNVRSLGDTFVKLAINKPIALKTQIDARLLDIDTKLWLEKEVLSLESSDILRLSKKNV